MAGVSGRVPDEPHSRLAASRCDPSREVWTDDLTDKELNMVIESGDDSFFGNSGCGVELRGGNWKTARSLVRKGCGSIEGGAPNGSNLPGLYFNNAHGVEVLHEFDDDVTVDEWLEP